MYKNNFKSQLVRIFSNYVELFSDVYCITSFEILLKYTHPKLVLEASKEDLMDDMVRVYGKG